MSTKRNYRTMRHYSLLLAMAFIVLMGSCANKKKAPAANDVAELLRLEHKGIMSEFAMDTAFLASIMDSTFMDVSSGARKNKQQVLQGMYLNARQNREAGILVDSIRMEDEVVHLYDGAAVVSFVLNTYIREGKERTARRTRFYDVWVKRGDGWKAVTWQVTPLEEEE